MIGEKTQILLGTTRCHVEHLMTWGVTETAREFLEIDRDARRRTVASVACLCGQNVSALERVVENSIICVKSALERCEKSGIREGISEHPV